MRFATLTICCTLLQACSPKEIAWVGAPAISSFTTSATSIFLTESTTLTPVFSNGAGSIDQGVGSVTSETTYVISPITDTTYTLTVTNAAGSAATAQLAIQVDRTPVVISNFTSSPDHVNYGEMTTLSWTIAGKATVLTLDGVSVLGKSSQTVSPVRRQTYVLAGSNPVGDDTRRLSIAARGLDLVAGSLGGWGSLDGTGIAARLNTPSGVAVDGSGNIYAADTNNHTIRKITPAGVVSTLAGLAFAPGNTDGPASEARFNFPQGLAVDGSENVYVADTNNHTIRKITPAGTVSTVAGRALAPGSTDGLASEARFFFPLGVAVDGFGNVYVADTNNHTIRKVTPPGIVSTVAGLALAPGSTDGPASEARFLSPLGVAVDGFGNVYVAVNCTIRKITPAGMVSTLAGQPGTYGSTDGPASEARFGYRSPYSVAVDGSGDVYAADADNHTIRKVTPTGVVSTLAGQPGIYGGTDGRGSEARFNSPRGVAVDGAGNVYVADTRYHTIRKITSAQVVSTLAGLAPISGSTDGTDSGARFNSPSGVAVDGSGNIYVADSGNHIIRKVTSAGVVSTLAGRASTPGSTDGPSGEARFNYPQGVTVDGFGNLYVADTLNHTIRKITPARVVSTVAGLASRPGAVDDAGSEARFNTPRGMAVDGSGNVYVADTPYHTIRKITPAGMVTTLAGLAAISGSTDGAGSGARFNSPSGVAVDGSGYIYVADTANHTIRKVTSAGVVSTLAGGAGTPGSTDGAGGAARFDRPTSVAVDGAGSVYVSDRNNHYIRKVTAEGVVTTIAGRRVPIGIALGPLPASLTEPSGIALTPAGDLVVTSIHSVLQITAF